MSATPLTTFAPPNALRMWTDGRSIYVELPCKEGPPYIISFPCSTGGLSKALDILKTHADYSGTPIVSTREIKRVGTHSQHATAERLLREIGLIK